ncbi:SDR family NAD(P)-dependent oxidoreductase [Streptomyces sp. NPDC101150]|uniref:SDR family NAD(P)-dependent oxidoreductase n=1 Tax=Streptomyces sp. NPDC101150 TaxID=3366114 RepID=UPI003830DC78
MPPIPPGSVAIVTGGASGIGQALCHALAERGVLAISADLTPAPAGPLRESVILDVTDAQAVHDTYHDIFDRHGRLDAVFSNAGIAVCGTAEELDLRHYQHAMDINFHGVLNSVQAAYPLMIRQRHGHIINTASIAGLTAFGGLGPYTASKHAVIGLTMGLRAEAARHNIRVSALCPSLVDTPLLTRLNPDLPATRLSRIGPALLDRLHPRPYPPDRLARYTLRRLRGNPAVIIAPFRARVVAAFARHTPALTVALIQHLAARTLNTPTSSTSSTRVPRSRPGPSPTTPPVPTPRTRPPHNETPISADGQRPAPAPRL